MASMTFESVGPINFESVSAVTATPSVDLGVKRTFAGEDYVYCYNAGTATAVVQMGVKLITGASGYSIARTSVTDVFNPCVGVVKHVDIPASSYGWIMTRGFATVNVVSASTADYKMIAFGASGLFIEASGTTTLGTATKVGYLLSHNTGAGGAAYGFISTGH
jgi:hypothetical protein